MLRRALISVSDKSGIIDLAHYLINKDIQIISTGGTARLLMEQNIPVTPVDHLTGFPECLDGRVKTLHPQIHGGILARRDDNQHQQQAQELGIQMIDLVIVNLYPFEATIQKPQVDLAEAIENIDIGGVALIRAAAKNYKDVLIVTDPRDYALLMEAEDPNQLDMEFRLKLAAKAFQVTAYYDSLIGSYLSQQLQPTETLLPECITLAFRKVQNLRYGENPHQPAGYYAEVNPPAGSLVHAKQLHGKGLSFNNINDAHGALELLKEFTEPTAVAVKHTNPCGVGTGETLFEAFQRAYEADPISIFGGIVALNRDVDEETAQKLKEIFLEIIIAPHFSDAALKVLKKKKNLRLLELPDLAHLQDLPQVKTYDYKRVSGGLLVQSTDEVLLNSDQLQVVTHRKPTETEMADLIFAWKVVKHTKSNAIVVAKNGKTLGLGVGQTSRIWAVENAIERSRESTLGAVLASDAFFPFADSVEAAHKAGITAVIQPGGSKRDQDSIDFCNEQGMAMLFTGIRHFKH
ncbi:MAG: bifunctional phosphoribosylaminoimidazolecarboxamide formyltransferase/IMP cyclohydrolase PurH [Gemmatimonadetes bacterium]|nr:MAG: bifunctional phosphoribosylaminoimidazolecarboxamide formyltransferase/IMP cyclohydrolase PurH [Gemmatimonadota bacterium]